MMLLNRHLVSSAKYCLVGVFKDCPEIRNLPKNFLRSFENVGPELMKGIIDLSLLCVCWPERR